MDCRLRSKLTVHYFLIFLLVFFICASIIKLPVFYLVLFRDEISYRIGYIMAMKIL